MIRIERLRSKKSEAIVNISPLIDLVFLLLIFFMVTTSFVRETGVDVERPSSDTAQGDQKSSVLIGISKDGRIFFEEKEIDIRSVKKHIKIKLSDNGTKSVIIVADKLTQTGDVIKVMDQLKLAGADNVSIAASVKGGHP
ncbi:MAG: biopolymer transporter ExbD [Desulfobacterales bacterium]|nr:biopolymer transporter ExbD [Desulfobacterales bacterium]